MAPSPSFHPFTRLPYELRLQIYILASPPRVVHLQEYPEIEGVDNDELEEEWMDAPETEYNDFIWRFAYEKMLERLRHGVLQTQLHHEIAYFSHNWREKVNEWNYGCRQTRLESFGFTSKKRGPYQPWVPTSEQPEIPLYLLDEHPEFAFQCLRKSYLYSNAVIPPFLHACSESREALINLGYRLAFGTRSNSPRIWFNFERDKLHLAYNQGHPYPWHYMEPRQFNMLSNTDWNLGQLRTGDLRRVKHLVLEGCGGIESDDLIVQISSIVRLLPNIETLDLEAWSRDSLTNWFKTADEKSPAHTNPPSSDKSTPEDGQRQLSWCVRVEDIDILIWSNCIATNSAYWDMPRLSGFADEYRKFNDHLDNGTSFYTNQTRKIENKLSSYLRRNARKGGFKVPNIPRINFVHVCPEPLLDRFLRGRQDFWRHYEEVKKEFARHKPFRPLTVDAPTPQPPFTICWCPDWRLRRFNSAINHDVWHDNMAIDSEDGMVMIEYVQGWYLTHGVIPQPESEIL